MRQLIKKLFAPKKTDEEKAKEAIDAAVKNRRQIDPLDIVERSQRWEQGNVANPIQLDITDFPIAEQEPERVNNATDAAFKAAVMDDNCDGPVSAKGRASAYTVPDQLQNWYMTQSFIGYQACAIIAQHWLVDKACSMAGEDAVRNGWEINALGQDEALSKPQLDELRLFDVKYKLKQNLAELDRFKNIFGIRVAIFHVESDDPQYYEKPFNIDGITKGSYKGISQIDPYWMMPMMTAESTADPANIHFYDPEFWVISGKKYHRSHLIISRGPQPADVLKPTYIFGGIPLVQRIYERVYAAERTANEAPLLSLSKRTTALHVDVEKALSNEKSFMERLGLWIKYRDNYAVKVLGKEESMEQFDTSLSDFDSVIMNQYQLVAAIAKVPATKLLGTSPKGFNATGEFETDSYHEELESIQEHGMHPMAQRHYDILCRSLGIDVEVEVVFNSTEAMTKEKLAELNLKKSQRAEIDINVGAIAPEEWRNVLRDDKHSGYNRLTDEEAETTPGMSPEMLAELEKAGAAEQKASAATISATSGAPENPKQEMTNPVKTDEENTDLAVSSANPNPPLDPSNDPIMSALGTLADRLRQIEECLIPDEEDLPNGMSYTGTRTVKPNVKGIAPSVTGVGSVMNQMDPVKLPKMKIGGIPISIENPRGTVRRGTTLDGENWRTTMPHHYGFIRGVMGADGDELDCFVGPNLKSDNVYVVNQNEPSTGQFDEHKCMFGFDSLEEAQAAYQSAYQEGWKGLDSIVQMTMEDFKDRLKNFEWNIPSEQHYIPKNKISNGE